MSRSLKSQSGQLIVEAVLIMVVFTAIVFSVANYFKSNEILKQLITGPWQNLAGLLQNGVWGSPESTNIIHPNARSRHIVITGEVP